jgi:glycosyltransferase involved in cell wall biosynthesis
VINMRILCLSAWWPEPADNGSRLRIAHLLRALAQEHEVHLVALSQEPTHGLQRSNIDAQCASVRVVSQRARSLRPADRIVSLWRSEPASVRMSWNSAFAAHVQERAQTTRPDVVVAFQLGMAPYACRIPQVPRVLEELEVAYMLEQYTRQPRGLRRLRAWLTWAKHRRYMTRLLRNFDLCTVASSQERELAQQLAPRSTDLVVVPNGADVDGCAGPWDDPEPDTLIYPGALSFSANYDAMTWFVRASFPLIRAARPSVRLLITGKADPELSAGLQAVDGIELTGYVQDVRPVVARSWCEVVPLRIGGGTRLKVLEALALGTPVVATSKGIEGLELEHDRHLLCADTAGDFARATTRLLSQPTLRSNLAAAGRQFVREHYDWRAIGRCLNDLLVETVSRGRRRMTCQTSI